MPSNTELPRINTPRPGDTALSSAPIPYRTRPIVKQRLRPQRSLSLLPGIMRIAMINKNRVIAAWTPCTVVSRSSVMSLIITFMLEPAKLQMNWASASGARKLRREMTAPADARSALNRPLGSRRAPRHAGPRLPPLPDSCPALLGECLGLQRLELLLRDRAGVEQLLGLRDLGGGPAAGRVAHIVVELVPLGLRLLDAALPHPVVLDDQIDQHPEPRQDDHEDDPRRLRPATDVVAAEDVDQHGDHDPD